jgi:integrase
MVDSGVLSRGVINHRIGRIKRAFKWAVSEELVPPVVYQGLAAVEGLRKGRTTARDNAPIKPVDDQTIDETVPRLPSVVADMVRLQRLTGCRPAEICLMRPCDVDRSASTWRYTPASHKTDYLSRGRTISIGPKGQAILARYLLRSADAYCFSPAESEQKRNEQRRASHQSPMTPSQARRRRKRHPRRPPGDRYTTVTYRRAIHRAVAQVNRERKRDARRAARAPDDIQLLPKWSPNRLRHTAATAIRKRFGLEAVQVTLGHATADVSQIYAERDLGLAETVMRELG